MRSSLPLLLIALVVSVGNGSEAPSGSGAPATDPPPLSTLFHHSLEMDNDVPWQLVVPDGSALLLHSISSIDSEVVEVRVDGNLVRFHFSDAPIPRGLPIVVREGQTLELLMPTALNPNFPFPPTGSTPNLDVEFSLVDNAHLDLPGTIDLPHVNLSKMSLSDLVHIHSPINFGSSAGLNGVVPSGQAIVFFELTRRTSGQVNVHRNGQIIRRIDSAGSGIQTRDTQLNSSFPIVFRENDALLIEGGAGPPVNIVAAVVPMSAIQ